jgi:hypothetical protein
MAIWTFNAESVLLRVMKLTELKGDAVFTGLPGYHENSTSMMLPTWSISGKGCDQFFFGRR